MLDAAVSSLPPLGVVLRAANQDNNDCRWQSYLCFVPRSGKGGVAGNFESLPFNEPHPLSQPLRAASSPTGEPRYAPTSPERGGGATAPEGSGAVRRIPIGMHQGEFVQAPLASPGGSQGDQVFSSKCMDRDLKRVSITCLAVARMSTWAT